MKRFLRLVIFTVIILLIGRNLTFLPQLPSWESFESPDQRMVKLKEKINDYLLTRPGSVSVYFLDLKTGDKFGINEKTIYTVGSLNKAYIVAVAYQLASKGELNFDETITVQAEDIQDYGTGSLRYEESGGVYSLKTLARLSLEQSDNTAAHILAKKIDMVKIQSLINEWGVSQTSMADNKTSLSDLALIFQKIYEGKVANPSLTKEMLGLMDDSLFEDRLPVLMPKQVKVYHKTGDVTGGVHDAGIIEFDGRAYFLGVLTSEQIDEGEAKKTIAEISKIVYEFESKRK